MDRPVLATPHGVRIRTKNGVVSIAKNPESAPLSKLQQKLQFKWVSWDVFGARRNAHGYNMPALSHHQRQWLMRRCSCHTNLCACDTCSDSYITKAPRQIADHTPRPLHALSTAVVLMARAFEATRLVFDGAVEDIEERVTRKAETADAVQDAVQLLHIGAFIPRELRPSTVDGFKARHSSAQLRGRIKREENRIARAVQRVRCMHSQTLLSLGCFITTMPCHMSFAQINEALEDEGLDGLKLLRVLAKLLAFSEPASRAGIDTEFLCNRIH